MSPEPPAGHRRTRVVIQSRLSSSRLPGKALLRLGGMPLIELVARRAARTGYEVVVATSREPYDDRIADHLNRVGVPVLRGDLDDVLGRFAAATADLADDDLVVRLTGDNPLMDADVIAELLAAAAGSGHAYGRVDIDVVPEGLGCEVFTAGDLRRAAAEATAPYDREHVTPWLRRTLGELLFAPAANPGDPVAYRATVDCLHDYDRVSRLFDEEPDPVGVGWSVLLGRLVAAVDAAGAQAPPVDRDGPRLSQVLLGTSLAGRTGAAGRDAAAVRALFVRAVDAGASHAVAGPGEAGVLAAGTLPALRQRLGLIVTLPAVERPIDSPAHLAWQVRAGVERAMAEVQQRTLGGVLFASAEDAFAGDGGAWAALQEYVREGRVAEPGVVVGDPDHLGLFSDLDGLRLVAVPGPDGRFLGHRAADQLTALAGRATILALAGDDPDAVAAALGVPWVDAVVAQPRSAAAWNAILAAVTPR